MTINYELNNVKFLQEKYLYRSYLVGYSIIKKINKKGNLVNTIFYIKSHHHKYEINVEQFFEEDKLKDINTIVKEVDNFTIISNKNNKINPLKYDIEYKYFYFDDEGFEDDIKVCKINEIDELKQYRLFNKTDVSKNEARCIYGETLFIALQNNKQNKYLEIFEKGKEIENEYEFAKKIMDIDELKQYIKNTREP